MKKLGKLLGVIALVAITVCTMTTCEQPDGNSGGNIPGIPGDGDGDGDGPKGPQNVVVIDISETTPWDLLVVGDNGTTMVFNVDEETGIPTQLFCRPDPNSDKGITVLFKQDGLPDIMIYDGTILYFDNFEGYDFDMAIIPSGEPRTDPALDSEEGRSVQGRAAAPTGEWNGEIMTYWWGLEKRWILDEADWEQYKKDWNSAGQQMIRDFGSGLFPLKALNTCLDALGKVMGTISCATAFTNPASAIGCGIFLLSEAAGAAVSYLADEGLISGLTAEVTGYIISGLGCVNGFGLADCLSAFSNGALLLASEDLKEIGIKQSQLDAAIKTLTKKPDPIAVIAVSLSPTSISNMTVGTTGRLTENIAPYNATNQRVTWSSSDSTVASVNAFGIVTAHKPGGAIITVTTVDGKKKATANVSVAAVIPVIGVTMKDTKFTINKGDCILPEEVISPAGATEQWIYGIESSNSNVLQKLRPLKFLGKAAGTATLTVTITTAGKKTFTATCEVTVVESGADKPTELVVTEATQSSISLAWPTVSGAGSYNIYRVAYSPMGSFVKVGTSPAPAYTDSGLLPTTTYYYKIAPVTGGKVGAYTDYVYATTTAKTLTAPVTAPPAAAPTGVTATAASNSGITVKWNAVSGASSYIVYRSATSSGTYSQVASTASTEYTNAGLTANTAYYYKIAARNSKGTGTQSVAVSATTSGGPPNPPDPPPNTAVTGVTLSRTRLILPINGTETLTATVAPSSAANKNVTWTTSNASVAAVNNGLVTAKAKGTATITVKTVDGEKTAACEVTVVDTVFIVADANEWAAAVDEINDAGDGTAAARKAYILNIDADFGLDGKITATFTPAYIDIALNGGGKTISLNSDSTGCLLYIDANQSVTMDGLTLKGHASNNVSVVRIFTNAFFTMNGGTISGNTVNGHGSGVIVATGGEFTMNGGTISGNTTTNVGGGVFVLGGTFTMNDGTIHGNTAANGGGLGLGMSSSNAAGTFIMNGGTISGNTATSITGGGGGVNIGNGTFTMNGGAIHGNTASNSGGGVFLGIENYNPVTSPTFIMKGGTISGNTANGQNTGGGGVYIANTNSNQGTFHISDGIVYGSDASDPALRNTAPNKGAAMLSGNYTTYVYYGTFDAQGGWVGAGTLVFNDTIDNTNGINNTVKVVNGVLQE